MRSTTSKAEGPQKTARRILARLVLAGGAAPLILYRLLFGRIATVTPQQARELLRQQEGATLPVDVRRPRSCPFGVSLLLPAVKRDYAVAAGKIALTAPRGPVE